MRPHRSEHGFSLIEALLAVTITLFVMAMVAQTMADASRVHRSQTELAASSSIATLALADILEEIARAGQGLGEGPPSVLPQLDGAVARDTLTLRSNPEVKASFLRGVVEDAGRPVPADSASTFEKGGLVLVTEASGRSESAEIVAVDVSSIALRSRETADGSFRRAFDPSRGVRALGVREVRYFLGAPGADGRRELVKDVVGVGRRVLSRDVLSLYFEYLDADDGPIALGTVPSSLELASVRVSLSYRPAESAPAPRTIKTRVALAPRSGTVDFERRDLGVRLSQVFHPIESPVAVSSRAGEDWAVILASGESEIRDPSYLYTFEMEKRFLSASVADVAFLYDVRGPVALAFGPENGPLEGSLFVAASGLRIGHLARVAPDEFGKLSRSSVVTTFEGTEDMAQAGGIAFGVDGALYATSREKGALYRFRFDSKQRPSRPERLFRLTGTPGALVEGTDGHLYFLMNHEERSSLWKMAFDETLEPLDPVEVGALPGTALALARDPVEGNLFALVDRLSDFVVVELDRRFLAGRAEDEPPRVVFDLDDWTSDRDLRPTDPRAVSSPGAENFQKLPPIGIEELDSLSFDGGGSLYLGNRDLDVVLKFELDRPSGRYAVGIAASVVDRGFDLAPEIRMHAWKKIVLAGQ